MADKGMVEEGDFLRADTRVFVRTATDGDRAAWDAFVLAHPEGSFFHRFAWHDLFRDVFALSPRYLVAERNGEIAGVLPLVHQKSRLFGDGLIAAPFVVEGGPIGDAAAVKALDSAALALMAQLRAPFVEFRCRKATRPGWIAKTGLYACFVRPLAADDDANLKAIPRKQRAVVRKAISGSLTAAAEEGVDALFRVYSESVRNLGTPVFPKRWFSALRAAFGSDCDVMVIRDGGVPVSAVMNFYHNGTVLPYYGGGTLAARKSGANDLVYWETMRHAARRGCTAFDFGRSKADTGAFAYKKNWGFEPEWLEYEYYLSPGSELPQKNPNNPKYAMFIAAWKKLPLPVANFLGPFLIRGLG
ncbi:FemAB family XrtA/PEP-CTERM system-associated protein [Rhizomicrobium electricum]|jgi:FemAB-related protein (PEP-CTERM system-associated)|uniref:FemAB family PEP-CTERM system-associated protein n=1 Tax=Rhizomicrobium electricum TaxID=480070 RepID=A0ABP3PM90_9PROT|nr:FemAB family XrtA/PEP-CTERM system-associated protein [Rhizomicrobium electricum]NIJ46888.1 FemAB-related protein (PEP-CTERM system-associated) [Rhizomicrobium electricum]